MNVELNLPVVRALMRLCRKDAQALARSTQIEADAIRSWVSGKTLSAQALHPANQLRLVAELGMKAGDLDRKVVHHWWLDEARYGVAPLKTVTEAFGKATAYSLEDYNWAGGRERIYVLHFDKDYVVVLHLLLPVFASSKIEEAGVELLTEAVTLSRALLKRIADQTVRLWELENAVDAEDHEVWAAVRTASREYLVDPDRILKYIVEQGRQDEERERQAAEAAAQAGAEQAELLEHHPNRDLGSVWLKVRRLEHVEVVDAVEGPASATAGAARG